MIDLTVSIVLYKTDKHELMNVLKLLENDALSISVYLIDNSPTDNLKNLHFKENVFYIFNNANVGYGSGHNIAIKKAANNSKYHLIMNADVDFEPLTIKKAFDYMENNLDVAMISPQIYFPDGQLQRSFRKLPTPFDLFARRFIPEFLTPVFKKKLDEYLLVNADHNKVMNIPNLPGCFMFTRTPILNEINGFDEGFFMYVEDIDLTRRLHEKAKTIYYPSIRIEHGLARGSFKISKLLVYHISSAIYYFNKWGWFFDKRRSEINRNL